MQYRFAVNFGILSSTEHVDIRYIQQQLQLFFFIFEVSYVLFTLCLKSLDPISIVLCVEEVVVHFMYSITQKNGEQLLGHIKTYYIEQLKTSYR